MGGWLRSCGAYCSCYCQQLCLLLASCLAMVMPTSTPCPSLSLSSCLSVALISSILSSSACHPNQRFLSSQPNCFVLCHSCQTMLHPNCGLFFRISFLSSQSSSPSASAMPHQIPLSSMQPNLSPCPLCSYNCRCLIKPCHNCPMLFDIPCLCATISTFVLLSSTRSPCRLNVSLQRRSPPLVG